MSLKVKTGTRAYLCPYMSNPHCDRVGYLWVVRDEDGTNHSRW